MHLIFIPNDNCQYHFLWTLQHIVSFRLVAIRRIYFLLSAIFRVCRLKQYFWILTILEKPCFITTHVYVRHKCTCPNYTKCYELYIIVILRTLLGLSIVWWVICWANSSKIFQNLFHCDTVRVDTVPTYDILTMLQWNICRKPTVVSAYHIT